MPITKLLYSFIENGPLTGSLFGTASYALDSVYSASLASRSNILESASSSFSTRVTNLVTDSGSFSSRAATLEIASGSFSTRITNLVSDSGSFSTRTETLEIASSSFSTRVTNLVSDSGSFSTRITNLVTDSSSFSTRTATLETASGSFSTRVTNLVSDSSSFSARLSSYTGSIFGTASYATKAETLVSGININAGLITASAISVTTLNVVTITSSIEYASGSNIFGTKSTDTQLFTGSVSITGSLTVNGTVTATSSYSSLAATASYFAGVTNGTTNYVAKFTSANVLGTSSIFESGSSVGIGTATPNKTGLSTMSTVNGATNSGYEVAVGDTRIVGLYASSTVAVLNAFANVPMQFSTNNATRMTLDTSGNLGIGTGSASQVVHAVNASTAYVLAETTGTGTSAGFRLKGSAAADYTLFTTQGTNQFAIYDNAASATRLTINSSGNVGIGTTSPAASASSKATVEASGCLVVGGAINAHQTNRGVFQFDSNTTSIRSYGATAGTGLITFHTGGGGGSADTERMRIDSSGNVGIGVTPGTWNSAYKAIQIGTAGVLYANTNANTVGLVCNSYGAASPNTDTYITNGVATRYYQYLGSHIWDYAASGTAGNAVSFSTKMTLDASGNLGIGTASPVSLLNPFKTTAGSSFTIANSFLQLSGGGSAGAVFPITFGYSGASAVNAPAYLGMVITNDASFTNGALVFGTRNVTTDTLPTERMRITSAGDVGIGTTSPSAKLHVFNSTAVSAQAVTSGTNLIIESATSSYLEFRNTSDNGTNQGILFVDNNLGGYVGFTNAATDQMFIGGYAAVNLQVGASNSFGGKTTIAAITSAGAAITGAITATGNITAYFSDDRLKTKLGKIENALDKICSLEGFYYEANDLAQSLGYKAVREVGISAQSVQSVLPEIVAPAPIDSKYLTIHYERTVPLIIEAIKELRNEIAALKK